MKNIKNILALMPLLIIVSACAPPSTRIAVEEQRSNGSILDRVNRALPAPDLGDRPTERAAAIHLMNIRNKEIRQTFTYQIEYGRVIFICESIGYPIPYAVQITNPKRFETIGGKYELVDSPENNGLYMPSSAEASWVPCVVNGKVYPVYYEGRVSTFPFEINNPDFKIAFKSNPSQTGIEIKDWTGK